MNKINKLTLLLVSSDPGYKIPTNRITGYPTPIGLCYSQPLGRIRHLPVNKISHYTDRWYDREFYYKGTMYNKSQTYLCLVPIYKKTAFSDDSNCLFFQPVYFSSIHVPAVHPDK